MAKKTTASLPLSDEAREVLLKLIHQSEQPQTANQLAAQLIGPFKVSANQLIPILDDFVASGTLFTFPPYRRQTPYWDRGLVEFGRVLIVQILDKKGPLSRADLKKAAKGLSEKPFQQAFESLIASRDVLEHPPLPKARTAKFGRKPPAPDEYLKDVGLQLTKIVAQLGAAGVTPVELAKAARGLFEQSGLSLVFADRAATNGGLADSPATPPADALGLLSLMREIEPGAERGALVPARDLRRAARLDKPHFDRAVLDLARQGRLMLHRHDYASGLSAAERDELVTDGAGTFYVGMALRRAEQE